MLLWVFLLITVAIGKAQATCGGIIQDRSGFITSPGFPHQYKNFDDCTWNIIAPLNHAVSLQFIDIEMESCEECSRCDYVAILSILPKGVDKLHGQICRTSDINQIFISEENHLRIRFRTDNGNTDRGFNASFTVTGGEEDPQKSSKNKNVQWLLNQINEKRSLELPRSILALFLAEAELFAPRNKTVTEPRDSLTIQVLSHISRNETVRTHELALYVQALLVTCQDPRDFYGHDLLSELRARVDASPTFVNPFEILALCNAGAEVTAKDVERVMAAFDSQRRPFWTDIQAIATMAMQCLSSKVAADERVISEMQDELKKRQFRNGTVENLVTTALVVQALGYKNSSVEFFDLPSALNVLVRAQEEDGSWGKSVRNSFYVLPAISKKSFLDINDKHCPKKIETEEESLAHLQEAGGDKFMVQYSVWIGGDVDLGRTWRVRVQSSRNTSFYDVIEMVTKLDSRHNVSYQVVDRKPYVRSLLGKEDDPESGIFWFTYVRSTSSKASPTLVESSPADVSVIPNQELILWYKSNDWNGNNTQGA